MTDKQIILSLTRELEAATKPKWIKFEAYTENSPENDRHYLALVNGQLKILFFCDDEYWCERYGGKGYEVTHWQPLPSKPQ